MHHDTSDQNAISEEFLRLYTREHFRIAGFIRSMVTDPVDASDVTQETSLAMFRSFHQYERDRDFASWAFGIARHQVLKHWRMKRREKLVFSETLINEIADETLFLLAGESTRFQALRDCIGRLTARQRDLVKDFYGNAVTAATVAKQWNCSIHAVYNSLRSVRKELQHCIDQRTLET